MGLLGLLSLAIGSRGLTLSEAWTGLIGHDQTVNSIVVWRLRMPRTILAIVVGACLSVAGVVMQALTRNPLAEPGILGVNAGASPGSGPVHLPADDPAGPDAAADSASLRPRL